MASTEMIDVAADGDIVLVCSGHSPSGASTKIRVSAAVLNNGSSVFKAMLSPRFNEGYELASSPAPTEITLPEDNAVALTVLCQVIHLRNTAIPIPLPSDVLLKLSFVADKYDCIEAIAPTVQLSVARYLPISNYTSGSVLLSMTYFMPNPKLFAQVAAELVMKTTGQLRLIDVPDVDLPPVLSQVIDFLSERKAFIESHLASTIEDKILDCLQRLPCLGPTGSYYDIQTAELLRRLQKVGLWPVSALHRGTTSIEAILSSMQQIDSGPCDKLEETLQGTTHHCTGRDGKDMEWFATRFAQRAKAFPALMATDKAPVLCLACAREGRVSDQNMGACGHELVGCEVLK